MHCWETNLIFKTIVGSHSYGLATEDSDLDVRGICFPNAEHIFGLKRFEQWENPEKDEVVYSLEKFIRLAADGNPNIIEMLFIEPQFHLHLNDYGKKILDNRDIFLSREAGMRYFHYAFAQVGRLESHYKWLLNPPVKPEPFEFGAIKMENGDIKWPEGSFKNDYTNKLRNYKNYDTWLKNRNEARAKLEKAYGYDTKFALHAVRLLVTMEELLSTGKLQVLRHDREFLLSVRNGSMTYEELVQFFRDKKEKVDELCENSPLPKKANHKKADELCIELQRKFFGC